MVNEYIVWPIPMCSPAESLQLLISTLTSALLLQATTFGTCAHHSACSFSAAENPDSRKDKIWVVLETSEVDATESSE
ncbi:hypothetical protein AVEN_132165-1 [Araneus ventricosus]|uniref:Uncharacterized protein n=1 Tax=Araneus ventricosus TaxID=182803 RepID=A0A4Y2MYY7_ARAVE|nr:hypothetical protein AVEN_132165-1 [Araneus ventricosus]